MIRLTLRQHRTQLGAAVAAFAVLALVLAWTEHQMTSYLHSSGFSACLAQGGGCDTISRVFENRYGRVTNKVNFERALTSVNPYNNCAYRCHLRR